MDPRGYSVAVREWAQASGFPTFWEIGEAYSRDNRPIIAASHLTKGLEVHLEAYTYKRIGELIYLLLLLISSSPF